MRVSSRVALLAALAACCLVANTAAEPVAYSVTSLSSLSGGGALNPAFVASINNAGVMTGSGPAGQGDIRHAFLYRGGALADLGTLGGVNSAGTAINAAGQVVGSSDVAGGSQHAFRYSGGVMSDLGTLGYAGSIAYGINNGGRVVGDLVNPDFSHRGFQYANGRMRELGTLGGDLSSARAVNDAGQIAGSAQRADGTVHAFLYTGGVMADLGTLGGFGSMAYDLNDHSQVIGASITTLGEYSSFIYADGVMTDLGRPVGRVGQTFAASINNQGEVVGNWFNPLTPQSGFVWRAGQMHDLNRLVDPASGWFIQDALDINDSGQIAAFGCRGNDCEALLLSPVPEPAAWMLMAAGLGLFSSGRWKRRRRAPGHPPACQGRVRN